AGQGLDERRTVIDAAAGEALRAWNFELAVLDAGGKQDAVAGDFAAAGELDEAVLTVDAHAGGALGEEFGAEAGGLDVGAAAELGAGDTGGKAEVIFDAGAGAGLASGRFGLDDQSTQAFAGAVNGGGKA